MLQYREGHRLKVRSWSSRIEQQARPMRGLGSESSRGSQKFGPRWASPSYGFSSSHVQMWKLDYKESWTPKNWCFWTVVLEKTLESPLECKGIKPVNPKGNQPWIFIGKTDAEAEALILWPPGAKSQLIWKDPDVGKDWRQKKRKTAEDELVR